MARIWFLRMGTAILLASAVLGRAHAAGLSGTAPRGVAAGGELDLLPTILSAVDGELGAGANVWVGRDRLRLRAVGAHIAFPPGGLTPSGFQDRRLTAAAGIVD